MTAQTPEQIRSELRNQLIYQAANIEARLATFRFLDHKVAINSSAGVLALVNKRGKVGFGVLSDRDLLLGDDGMITSVAAHWNGNGKVRENPEILAVEIVTLGEALKRDLANVRELLDNLAKETP